MAYFKLSLLTSLIKNDSINYSTQLISEFSSNSYQVADSNMFKQTSTFCYSNNEKFSIHSNNDKELTFSMTEKVLSDLGEWVNNPFISHLHIGSILLLEDQFKEQHLLTIKGISLQFSKENIVYNYTCQDSFSYSLIRHNSGYAIVNDASSIDFIGSQNIDYWCNKITDECQISYKYVPIEESLIVDGKIVKSSLEMPETFSLSVSNSNAKSALIEAVEQISYQIKVFEKLNLTTHELKLYFWVEPSKNTNYTGLTYSPEYNIQDYNVNLKGDSLTTILNVESHSLGDEEITLLPNLSPFFSKYVASSYWEDSVFTPGFFQRLLRGITYSSLITNLTTTGDSKKLTITNPQGYFSAKYYNQIDLQKNFQPYYSTVVGEDNKTERTYLNLKDIKLITVPEFSIDSTEGKYSTKGFYISTITIPVGAQCYGYNRDGKEVGLITLDTEVTVNTFFENTNISGTLSENKLIINSMLYLQNSLIVNLSSGHNYQFTNLPESLANTDIVKLVFEQLPTNTAIQSFNEKEEYALIDNKIPQICLNKIFNITAEVSDDLTDINDETSNLTMEVFIGTEVTEEDEEFAKIADTCPWLENCLIDLSYFVKQKILSPKEWEKIMIMFNDRLRKVNGKLMYYSREYYSSIQQKTKIVANVMNKFDTLGAIIQSDILKSYETLGRIEPPKNFLDTYKQIFSLSSIQKSFLLDRNKLISEHFTKFFNSQQRMLKYLYKFKEYFNSANDFTNINQTKKLIFDTPAFNNNCDPIYTLSFDEYKWEEITSASLPTYPIFKLSVWDGLQHNEIKIVHDKNYKNYLEISNNADDYVKTKQIKDDKQTYFIKTNDGYVPTNYQDAFKQAKTNTNVSYYKQDNKTLFSEVKKYWNSLFTNDDGNSLFTSNNKLIFTSTLQLKKNEECKVTENDNSTISNLFLRTYVSNFPLKEIYYKGEEGDEYKSMYYISALGNANLINFSNVTSSKFREIVDTSAEGEFNTYYRNNGVHYDTVSLPKKTLRGTELTSELCNYTDENNISKNSEDNMEELFCISYPYNIPATNDRNYDNFYHNIAATYNYTPEKGSLYVQDKYWYLIEQSQQINKDTRTYYLLKWPFNSLASAGDKNNYIVSSYSRLSHYFLKNYMTELTNFNGTNLYDIVNEVVKPKEIKNNGNNIYSCIADGYYYSIVFEDDNKLIKITRNDKHESTDEIFNNIADVVDLYDSDYNLINWQENNYYILKPSSITINNNEFDKTKTYYYKENDYFIKAYTITGLQDLLDSNKSFQLFQYSNLTSYQTGNYENRYLIYPTLQKIYFNTDGEITTESNVSEYPLVDANSSYWDEEFPFTIIHSNDAMITYLNQQYRNVIKVIDDTSNTTPSENLTKGEFWYKYHADVDNTLAFNEAAVIEAELSSYWNVAYVASLNSDYMLPERWQVNVDGINNNFFDKIFTISDQKIKLNYNLFPNVLMLESKELPLYKMEYTNTRQDNSNILGSNPVIKAALELINENTKLMDLNHWKFSENGITTYYYIKENTGWRWKNMASKLLSTSPIYENLSGSDMMFIRYLLTYYNNKSEGLYEIEKEKQKKIWKFLYTQYPNIFLSNSFTNTMATNSIDLLQSAQYAMKDYSNPEKEYNLTLINNVSLFQSHDDSGRIIYKPVTNKINIGDPIKINAWEYRDQLDDIYHILAQYLFITDISYDLRKDGDLQVTVNSIKYQDKLIKSLVKLIK